jgi:hypothetical protein
MFTKRMRLFLPGIKYNCDCDNYVGVGVEDVTIEQWKEIAELSGDKRWRVTKAISERNVFDWIILVYMDNKLKAATYLQSYRRYSGLG